MESWTDGTQRFMNWLRGREGIWDIRALYFFGSSILLDFIKVILQQFQSMSSSHFTSTFSINQSLNKTRRLVDSIFSQIQRFKDNNIQTLKYFIWCTPFTASLHPLVLRHSVFDWCTWFWISTLNKTITSLSSMSVEYIIMFLFIHYPND